MELPPCYLPNVFCRTDAGDDPSPKYEHNARNYMVVALLLGRHPVGPGRDKSCLWPFSGRHNEPAALS